MKFKIIIAIICFLCLFFVKDVTTSKSNLRFVKVDSEDFKVDGDIFKFVGANTVYLVFYDDLNLDLKEVIEEASKNNIKVIRVYMDWGGWAKPEDYDRILDLASKEEIYVIISLIDCCRSADYPDLRSYFKERPFCNIKDNGKLRAYKNRIKEIVTRKNSFNGKIYREDNTIFAWEIANELEYWNFSPVKTKNWITEITSYIKSLDSNHLVSMGIGTDSEDFDKKEYVYNIFNVSEIDFYSIHFYPFSNEWKKEIKNENYIKKIKFRIQKFLLMGKPVIIGEFGFSSSGKINKKVRLDSKTQKLYYKVLKDIMDISFSSGVSGVMFWGWGVPEVEKVDMWWVSEIHKTTEDKFVNFIKNYKIPR